MISRNLITNIAQEVGFDLVGVVRAEAMPELRNRFEKWLLEGNQSTLAYLERNVDKRFDQRLLVEGVRSVVVCAVSYLSPLSRGYGDSDVPKVASYAVAKDYHRQIKQMLTELAERLCQAAPTLRYRAFTDSAPVAEKSLAVKAGLGWIGRNSLLVTPKFGSMVLLGELFISEQSDAYDEPMQDGGCGSCRACVAACPNSAILDYRAIDTRRCISRLTIERADEEDALPLHGWIFGCDMCQSVCPYNRRAQLHRNPRFDAVFDPLSLDRVAWQAMSEEEFEALAGETPLTRSGLERLKSNINK